jgi:hypothetical protein
MLHAGFRIFEGSYVPVFHAGFRIFEEYPGALFSSKSEFILTEQSAVTGAWTDELVPRGTVWPS